MKAMTPRTERKAAAYLAGFACSVLATTAAAGEPSRVVDAVGPLKVGKACPSFGGYTPQNDILSLAKLLRPDGAAPASVVVISFFATACKACKERLPSVERVVAALADKGARGVLIDVGDEADAVTAFAQNQKLRLPIILDRFTKIVDRLGVGQKLPRTLVVGRGGDVRTIFDHEGDDFEQALRSAVLTAMR